jgi:hypothetical protein
MDSDWEQRGRKIVYPKFRESMYVDPKKLDRRIPEVVDIWNFLSACFNRAGFSVASAIVMLLFVNRFIGVTHEPLTYDNWRPIVITALLISQKVQDDSPILNSSFQLFYPTLTLTNLNVLEKSFCDILNWNVSATNTTLAPLCVDQHIWLSDDQIVAKSALYCEYYFQLRGIVEPTYDGPVPIHSHTSQNGHETEREDHRRYWLRKTLLRLRPRFKLSRISATVEDLLTPCLWKMPKIHC